MPPVPDSSLTMRPTRGLASDEDILQLILTHDRALHAARLNAYFLEPDFLLATLAFDAAGALSLEVCAG
jgi:hypothetical protein